jgi:hypothetical protein
MRIRAARVGQFDRLHTVIASVDRVTSAVPLGDQRDHGLPDLP